MTTPECDPTQTTTFKVRLPGGTLLQLTAKRMAEIIAFVACLGAVGNTFLLWHLIKATDANTLAVQAGTAETRIRMERLHGSNLYVACVTLNNYDTDRQRVERNCRASSGVAQ